VPVAARNRPEIRFGDFGALHVESAVGLAADLDIDLIGAGRNLDLRGGGERQPRSGEKDQ